MNITFFIGNGFDINLGLKTSYSDFYGYFAEKASNDNMIRKWLEEDGQNVSLWSDLESALGQKIGRKMEKVNNDTLDKFNNDKIELDRLLLDYLEGEQQQLSFESKEEIATEMERSLQRYTDNLSEADETSIKSTCNKFKEEEFKYCFVCFNYTDTLDQIIDITKSLKPKIATHASGGLIVKDTIGDLVHIHGKLDEGMILGVNDKDQINNEELSNNDDLLDTFVKEWANEAIGQRRVDHVRDILKQSHIICIFGMSMGETDKMWWVEIINWLESNESNKVIVCSFSDEINQQRRPVSSMVPLRKDAKNTLLRYAGLDRGSPEYSKLSKQVLVSFNTKIFEFKDLLLEHSTEKN
ncbi:MAG: bacteriophage abortive infection AbiH family protein [Oscillospiraceae bacterium]|nr:bacteriophage abortive infection AbiH family protein [Oscillospiraceae bacterium]